MTEFLEFFRRYRSIADVLTGPLLVPILMFANKKSKIARISIYVFVMLNYWLYLALSKHADNPWLLFLLSALLFILMYHFNNRSKNPG